MKSASKGEAGNNSNEQKNKGLIYMGCEISRRSMLKGAALGMAAAGLSMGAAAAYAETKQGEVVANVSKHNDQVSEYQDVFDVLVLGCGAAGMSAAWQAATEGCRVGLVEIMPNYYEANSSICAGMLWGWNSEIQKANGVPEQDYDTCMAYLEACGGGHEDREMSDVFIREADGILEWMLGLGMELPEDGLTAFGAEYLVADVVEPVPHSHANVQGTGRGFTDPLFKACQDAGVEFIWNCRATNLITDASGRVVGAVTEKGNFRGNKGVVVATAGFSRNEKLINNFMPDLAGSCAGTHSQGDGIIMGAAVGAQLSNMWCLQGGSVGSFMDGGICYDHLLGSLGKGCIEVGIDGLRHWDEGNYYETKYELLKTMPEKCCWVIWDQKTTDRGPSICFAPPCSANFEAEVAKGYVFRADTIEELAEQIELDPEVLAATMTRYNEMAEAGVDEDFGRTFELEPLNNPPYYASKGVGCTSDTAGGLKINVEAEVLDWDDAPIPGLYAAGSTTGGWRGDTYQGCGTSISMACIFGRRAGRNAAADAGSAYEGKLASDAGAYLNEEELQVELAENQYLGSDMGMGGTITVRVTIDGDKLTDVEIVGSDETVGIGTRAVEELPATILEAQTWGVDAVAGATVSSTAIKNAVKQCMEQAGLA